MPTGGNTRHVNTLQSDNAIISAESLSKAFDGISAVDNLTLDVPAGSIFGFIGPSGCGKTTSVRLMLGIYEPDEGTINVLGQSPKSFGFRQREKIGYMPQQFVLYPELTLRENLNFAASIYGVPLRRGDRIQELLELVELTGHENKKVKDMSGGMQRRLSLVAALIHDPTLIFLDEPTAGIDPVLRHKFWEYFQRLKAEGHTLFVTTQYVGEASYCDYIGVMVEGRLLMVETPDGLRRHAMGGDVIHLHTRRYMSEDEFEQLKAQPFVLAQKVERLKSRGVEIVVDDASEALPLLLEWCHDTDIPVESASEHVAHFDEVFVELVQAESAERQDATAEVLEVAHE